MNKYIIPICNITESKVYNKIVFAKSYSACQDKIMQEFADYAEHDDWNEFLDDLDKNDILIGEINDIEEL